MAKYCKVGKIVEILPKQHKNALIIAFRDSYKVSSYSIMKALEEAGFNIGERTIDRHRTNKCICYKNQLGETNE